MTAPSFDVVVPTIGRPSLQRTLRAVCFGCGPEPSRVIVVDDRPGVGCRPLRLPFRSPVEVVVRRSYGSGPAAARNVGWTSGTADWVAFLDDDVEPPFEWRAALADDLARVHDDDDVVGSQGVVHVPLPTGRRPCDHERNVAGLAGAPWITADLAYRRRALEAVGGFDQRFRRAYREDSDLALQVLARGGTIATGRREVVHPVRRAPWTVSVRNQRGNTDDALMRRRYGRDWRERAHARPSRFPRHVATVACAVGAVGLLAARRPRAASGAAVAWAVASAEFFAARARPGPRRPGELATLAVTSAVIPAVAVWARIRGELRTLLDARRGLGPTARISAEPEVRAVLFDRDGTLVHDVPYNGDPDAVALVDGAVDAVDRLRAAGLRMAVVTNQSGVGRGLLTLDDVVAVHRRIRTELAGIDVWLVCPHGPENRCRCRKPAPGLVAAAAARLGVAPSCCVVIGDTEADVAAARAAGARAILVPNAATRPEEVARSPETAPDLATAVDRILATEARV